VIHTWIDTWEYEYPLSGDDAAELAERFAIIPALLEQARGNLVGPGRDLWRLSVASMRAQSQDLTSYRAQVAGSSAALDDALQQAIVATDEFGDWVESQVGYKNGLSGVGKDNYSWYLQNVHLVPYTWEEALTLMKRELWRANASLRLEENRNRHLPEQNRYANAEEYDAALNQGVTGFMEFLGEEEIMSIRDYMDEAGDSSRRSSTATGRSCARTATTGSTWRA